MPRSLTAPMVHSTDHEVVSSLGSSGSSGHDSDDTIPGFGSEKTTLALRPRPPLTPTPHEAWARAGDTGARPYDHRTRGACQTGWLWPRRRTRWNRRSGDGTTWRNPHRPLGRDRKSTRLNSSHVASSYAVFCLKKKKRHEY